MRPSSIKHAALACAMLAVSPLQALAASSGTCPTKAVGLLDGLTRADYAAAAGYLSPEVAKMLDAGKLKAAWRGIQTKAGAYVSHGTPRDAFKDNTPVTVMPVRFAAATLDMVVACDGAGRISAWRFLPPALVDVVTQKTPSRGVQARVEPDGVRVSPLDVPTPVGPLRGALTLPAGRGPFPAVVLVAGSGAQDMDERLGPNKPFQDLADGLARAGVASLRYDKRPFDYPHAWGAGSRSPIDAEVTDDAVAAARLLARQKGVDPRRVFVVGHSLGAMMAPRIGHREPSLAGIVLLAGPARRALDVLERQVRDQLVQAGRPAADVARAVRPYAQERKLLAAVGPDDAAPSGDFEGQPQAYWLSWSRVDPVADAKTLAMPMLLLQGGRDFQVSPTLDFARWKQALAGRPSTAFHLYPALSHLFMPAGSTGTLADYAAPAHVDARVVADIAAWVEAQAPARQAAAR